MARLFFTLRSTDLNVNDSVRSLTLTFFLVFFTARGYAERGYATVCRLSVSPSVRLSVTFRYRDHISGNT